MGSDGPVRRCARAGLGTALALAVATSAFAKPPSWDKQIDGPGRFKVLAAWDGAAVLDKETGLVWERAPIDATADWANAVSDCTFTETGGRLGWRLPRIEELMTVLDAAGSPPPGHPFTLPTGQYWSATTPAGNTGPNTTIAYSVLLGSGIGSSVKTLPFRRWCVRGGPGIDDQ
jgi:hypothetical protein